MKPIIRENLILKQILNGLLEINNDRVLIYSLVKNEIIHEDIKLILDACIKSSLFCSAQLVEEIQKISTNSIEDSKTDHNQDFFNVWLVIDECLSRHNRGRINSLFKASENIFKNAYAKALKNENSMHLSLRHKNFIMKQKEFFVAS